MSSPRPTRRLAFAALILGLGISGPSLAGDLNPPAGPVAPTQKPLSEVEPRKLINAANTPGDADSVFRIAQPGSYYLGASITGASGKHGIKISASPVTIDLNGFTLSGVSGSLSGISVQGAQSNTAVINGHVVEWGQRGIDLTNSQGGRVQEITARINTTDGIVTGPNMIVHQCVATGNGSDGIAAGFGNSVSASIGRGNGGDGLRVHSGSRVDGCIAESNLASGITMFGGSTIHACASRLNASHGLVLSASCSVTNCSFVQNAFDGILDSSDGSVIENCASDTNGRHGFSGGGLLRGCRAFNNTGSGIVAYVGTVLDCTVRRNGQHGIEISNVSGGACILRGNHCVANGVQTTTGAGIRVNADGARIEDNNVVGNDVGIQITGTVNIVLGNTSRGNTAGNFDIVANNRVGVIIVPPLSGVISGNSGAAGLGSTDPTANYAY